MAAGGIAGERLRSLVERIERLEEEKASLAADVREVCAEAKADGYDVKIMRQIIKLRKMDHADRAEQEEILVLYKHALGMEDSPPNSEATSESAPEPAVEEIAVPELADEEAAAPTP
jgi:uncharacterized protein (UPF0335 family)